MNPRTTDATGGATGLLRRLRAPGNWLRFLIIVQVLALAGFLLGRQASLGREPSYRGRTLSQWLEARVSTRMFMGPQCAEAFRSMGPAAVPHLVRALKQRDSIFFELRQWLYRWVPPNATRFLPEQELSPEALRQRAAWALSTVGPPAREALPAVLVSLRDRNTHVRRLSLSALTSITADPADLVPPLTERLSDRETSIRIQAVDALAALGPASRSAVPAFSAPLSDPDAIYRSRAGLALLQIDPGNRDALRVLLQAVTSPDRASINLVSRNLHLVTAAGVAAAPLLEALTQDADLTVRERALEARVRIGEAAGSF